MCQKGMGTLGSIIDLFAAEAASGTAWFLSLKEKQLWQLKLLYRENILHTVKNAFLKFFCLNSSPNISILKTKFFPEKKSK